MPAGTLLPNWMTGYAFLFPADADVPRARQIRDEIGQVPSWSLGYDSADPVARVVAERVTLNAFTTVGNWRGYGSIDHGGVHYGQKAHSVTSNLSIV